MSAHQGDIRRRDRRLLAVVLLVLAMVPGYYAVTLPWAPQTAFDIIGILQLVHNLPRLLALALTIGLAIGGVGLWVGDLRERAP